jgi:outer membrane lipase/esterase
MKLRYALVLVRSFFLAACFLGATLHTATAEPISGLFIFGDSLSDPGNNAILLNPPPSSPNNVTLPSDITGNSFIPTFPYAPSYQYTNGNVWAYQFATMLGLPSAVAGPVLGGGLGSNFAFGGATTGPLNNVGSVPSLLTQAANFVAALGPASAPANALYVVAGGGNNAREAMTAIAGGADPTATIGAAAIQFAADIGSIVDTLQAKGAERIIVWDVVNLGFAPAIAAKGEQAASLATTLTQAMNDALGYRLATESNVLTFDIFGLTTSIAANPAAYGLTNDSDAGGAIPGADLSTYLFWDGIHPTAAGHVILATSMVALTMSVPEIDPAGGSSVVALVVGVLGLIERRRPTGARAPATHRSPTNPC